MSRVNFNLILRERERLGTGENLREWGVYKQRERRVSEREWKEGEIIFTLLQLPQDS